MRRYEYRRINKKTDHLNQAINDLSAIANKLADIIAPNK